MVPVGFLAHLQDLGLIVLPTRMSGEEKKSEKFFTFSELLFSLGGRS